MAGKLNIISVEVIFNQLISMMQSGPPTFMNRPSDTRPACKKCGYQGHLTFECRNFVQLDPEKEVLLDVSSTSSESDADYSTPLQELRAAELKSKLAKSKKSKKVKKEKKVKKRRYSSSSDSEPSDSESDEELYTSSRKKVKKSKKEKKSKKSKKAKKSKRKKSKRETPSESD